jgi:hypothetical protein
MALIGNYLPRRCGIATFTTDLPEALAIEAQEMIEACIERHTRSQKMRNGLRRLGAATTGSWAGTT